MEEARFFDPTAVAAGAIGGGQLGVVGGVLTRPQIDKTEQSQTDLNQTKEQAKDDVGEQLGLDLDDPNSVEQYKADQERKAKQAAQEAKQTEDQQNAEKEVLRSEAKEFSKPDFEKQLNAKLETSIDDETSELGIRFKQFLNTPTDDNPDGIIDDVEIQEARKDFIKKEKEAAGFELDDKGNIKRNTPAFNNAFVAELRRRVAEKVKNEGQIDLDFNQETQEEKQDKAMAMVVRNQKTAIAKSKALFGENFINDPKYADLAAAINAVNFNVKKFNAQLDKIINPPAPEIISPDQKGGEGATVINNQRDSSTDVALNETTALSKVVDKIDKLKLAPSEEKIANLLLQATRDGTINQLIDSKGVPIHDEIRKRVGLNSRQASRTSLTRLMNKLAKGLGSTTDEFKTFLRATGKRAEDTGPEVFNDASQEFDASDLVKDQQLYVE